VESCFGSGYGTRDCISGGGSSLIGLLSSKVIFQLIAGFECN
jgi:hypothetical protein